jgi:hypothetical protein
MTATFTRDLLAGLGEKLEIAGIGTWTPGAIPPADSVLISAIHLPQAPDQVICLTDYPVAGWPGLTDVVIGVQVRIRGLPNDPAGAANLGDRVYDTLNGLTRATLGTAPNQVIVSQVYWQSGTNLGQDSLGRWERSANYYVQVNRAGPNQGN